MQRRAIKTQQVAPLSKDSYIPWIRKYRPKHLTGIVGNEATIAKLMSFAAAGSFPNMSFVGPPGTGKTTAAECLVNDALRGRGAYKVLNASDERGIKVIQTKVKEFATHKSLASKFKVLVLDEADYLTDEAQTCLREVIGQNLGNCRFILTANEGGRIIEALYSRCPPFPFERLVDTAVVKVLQQILQQEQKTIEPVALGEIVVSAEGDLRTAITRLETACSGVDYVAMRDIEFMRAPRGADIERVLEIAITGTFEAALGAWIELSIYLNPRRFLNGAVQYLYATINPNIDKRKLAECLAGVDWTRGSEECQVLGLIARLNKS